MDRTLPGFEKAAKLQQRCILQMLAMALQEC
jgi:hypothetical protein